MNEAMIVCTQYCDDDKTFASAIWEGPHDAPVRISEVFLKESPYTASIIEHWGLELIGRENNDTSVFRGTKNFDAAFVVRVEIAGQEVICK